MRGTMIEKCGECLNKKVRPIFGGYFCALMKRLRKIGWCAGCKDFCGLNGCAGVGMANCTAENDHYQFSLKEEQA